MRLKLLLMLMCLTISMIPIGIIGGFQGFEVATAFLGLILLITLFVSLLLTQLILRPLEKLTRNIDEISKGNLDVKLDQSDIYEINVLTQSLDRVMTSLKLAIRKIGVKKAEIFQEALQQKTQTEEKYKDFLQILDGWTWQTDAKGIFIDCSKNIKKILNYNAEEVLGTSIYSLIDSKESKQLDKSFKHHCKNPEKIMKQYTNFLDKTGKKVSIYMSWMALFDEKKILQGYRGISLNTLESNNSSSNKELCQENTKSSQKISKPTTPGLSKQTQYGLSSALLQNQSQEMVCCDSGNVDYVFLLDDQGTIVNCSDDIYKKLGYCKDELIHTNLCTIDIIDDKKTIQLLINNSKKQGSVCIKSIHKQKDGSKTLVTEDIIYLKKENLYRCMVKKDV